MLTTTASITIPKIHALFLQPVTVTAAPQPQFCFKNHKPSASPPSREFETFYHAVISHSLILDAIWRLIIFSLLLPPALILTRLWRYINRCLTYLPTYWNADLAFPFIFETACAYTHSSNAITDGKMTMKMMMIMMMIIPRLVKAGSGGQLTLPL